MMESFQDWALRPFGIGRKADAVSDSNGTESDLASHPGEC